jgi:hypothetical protein
MDMPREQSKSTDLEKQAVLESGAENITHKGERLFVCVPHSNALISLSGTDSSSTGE